ncbi:N-alpha-acetyltransferase 25, NatB auxiliary subunit [Phytophthora ramorum]|uniref:N-alpha-acetyltransferase 25, NatB auxiliary subunit n=1 Tax=Phytophthora ramorum TaxID=164328 RepID=UPI0030AC0A0D|nr:N-alpha-acetyltransferase 25, NatB auxiliary subunit [Phytophthora ramorum]
MADDGRLMARYVRPIYDAIDGRQYKAAIKLAQHKRVAHLDIVQVLKAHCLERTGRVEEALDICRRVQLKQPTDDTLLNTMNLVFKLGGCEHEMLPTFEHACAVSSPPDEDLFQSLFVAYARRGAFLKQQQTALKMFKAFGNIKYVCWAALSMMLQVEHGGTPARMLALAEKMLLKTLRGTGSDDGEALQLTVLIMQLQSNHQGALEAFDEFVKVDDGKKDKKKVKLGRAAEGEGAYDEEIELGPMQAIDRLSLEATLAKNVANWTRCAAVNRKLLEEFNADDWTFLKEYIAARFEETSDRTAKELQVLGKEITGFLKGLQSRPGNERIRGPALALIHVSSEILRRLQSGDGAVAQVEVELQALIVAYADRFYSKACCFTDLKQYFTLYLKESTLVSASAKSNLVQHFCKLSEEAAKLLKNYPTGDDVDGKERKEGQGNLSKRLLALKTLRFLGYYEKFSVDELDHVVNELEAEYDAASWLNIGSAGGQREVQLTDDLLLLATHFLLDIYQRSSGHREYLERAAGLLEYGLEKSAYNFQMKLLLSRVYGYLGAAEAMLSRHAELDVKYVQLDSLTFLVLDKMLDLCQHSEAKKLVNRIAALHRSTANDTPEYISRAYRLGVYSKVVDMSSFLHKRMMKSHTLAISRGETLRFELLDSLALGPAKLHDFVTSSSFDAQITVLEEMLVSDGAELSRNQHREVVVDWASKQQIPTGSLFAQDTAPLVECDRSADSTSSLLWLKLRVLVPKLLRSLAVDDHAALKSLTEEYDDIVAQLHLTGSGSGDPQLHEKLWKWSSEAIATSARIMNAVNGEDKEGGDLSAAITKLQDDFTAIVELLRAGLVYTSGDSSDTTVSLSPYGVSTLSALLSDCGLASFSVLALAQRALAKKKSKKSEQLSTPASALRNLLKHMQEELGSLEMRVTELKFTSHSSTSKASSLARDQAQQKAHANVVKAYESLQLRMVKMLGERSASIRTILQK